MNLLPLAALLEQAYRLALDAQDRGTLAAATAGTDTNSVSELIDVLDEARVELLALHRSAQADLAEQAVTPPQGATHTPNDWLLARYMAASAARR